MMTGIASLLLLIGNTPTDPTVLVDQIRNEIVHRYSEKYNVRLGAILDGMPEGIVHEVGVYLDIYREVSKEESRQIVTECVEDFLNSINSNTDLRPWLKTYPFTAKNIDVTLFVHQMDGSDVKHPNLAIISARHGHVIYKTPNPHGPEKYLISEESFEEALSEETHRHR